jgi:hypothetical protein
VTRDRAYLDTLRAVPALRACTDTQLRRIARLVDAIEVPAGATVAATEREIVITLAPARLVAIDRRVLESCTALAPGLSTRPRTPRTCCRSVGAPPRCAVRRGA